MLLFALPLPLLLVPPPSILDNLQVELQLITLNVGESGLSELAKEIKYLESCATSQSAGQYVLSYELTELGVIFSDDLS